MPTDNQRYNVPPVPGWGLRLGLLLAACLGNVLAVAVVPGVQYLLGSVFVLLAVALFGLRWGILAALASALPLLTQGEYSMASVLMLEPLLVGYGMHRRPDGSLFLIDGLFWMSVGGPLVWMLTPDAGEIPLPELAALYQLLVGLTNALLAGLLLSLTPLPRWAGWREARLSFQALLFHFSAGVALGLTLVLLTLAGRSDFSDVDRTAREALHKTLRTVEQQVEKLLEDTSLADADALQQLHEVLITEAGNRNLDMVFLGPDRQPLASTYARYREAEMWDLVNIARYAKPDQEAPPFFSRPVLGDFRDWVDARYRVVVSVGNVLANDNGGASTLVLVKPLAPLLESVYRNYLRTLAAGLTVLLLALAITWEVSRRLVRPLWRLGEVAASLPQRLYEDDEPAWRSSRIREIAWLTDSVHKMDSRLRREFQVSAQAHCRLRRAFRHLEAEVQERRAAEERVRDQQNELAHMARLSLASEMASGMAHELNQPLTAIGLYVHTLKARVRRDRADTDALCKGLDRIATQATRADEIIQRLRGLVRKTKPQCQAECLNALLHEVLALSDMDLRKREVHVRLDLAPDPLPVWVDDIQIQQVLLNLVRNAAEAMEQTPRDDRELRIRTRTEGEYVTVEVADRGPGVPVGRSQELFQPFTTTKSQGMGVGLWISRSLVEAHGGWLTVEDHAPGGALFRVTLCRANGA